MWHSPVIICNLCQELSDDDWHFHETPKQLRVQAFVKHWFAIPDLTNHFHTITGLNRKNDQCVITFTKSYDIYDGCMAALVWERTGTSKQLQSVTRNRLDSGLRWLWSSLRSWVSVNPVDPVAVDADGILWSYAR